jgi:putative DNA primase/helicase
VPFLQNIPKEERDPDLAEKLKAEAPAILRWAIAGCLAWQKQGLNPPETVRVASQSYLEGEDVLGQWIDERCEPGSVLDLTPFDDLYQDWKAWCEINGGPGWGGKALSKALDERGYQRSRDAKTRGFKGIKLRPKPGGKPPENPPSSGWEERL